MKAAKLIVVSAFSFTCIALGAPAYHLWLLDEGRGTVAVDSGNAPADLTLVSPQWAKGGPAGQGTALALDGTGKTYGTREMGLSIRTVEMWIRPAKLSGVQFLFSTKYTSTSRLSLSLSDGDLLGSDTWWAQTQGVAAAKAFTAADIGKWTHVAFTLDMKGYRLYKNGRLLARKAGTPFASQADHVALGINVWDLKGNPFHGDLAQVRLSDQELGPGKGTGKGELAWSASLASARLTRPDLEWRPGPREGNLFIREETPVLALRVFNRFYEPLAPMTIRVDRQNQYTGANLPPIEVKLAQPLGPRSEKVIPVGLGMTDAGVYRVTARGPQESWGETSAAWIRGPRPEEERLAPIAFAGNSSHTGFEKEDWLLRREFGSRAERGSQVMWQGVEKPGRIAWPEIHTDRIKAQALATGSEVFGFTGYTPAFASPQPPGKKAIHDVPRLDSYVDWVEQATRHYGGVIRYWEIWNEPNGDGTFFRGSAEELADLHKAAFLAAKRVDPQLKIIGGSLVSADVEYLDRLSEAGAIDYMDVIAFHNYHWDYPPDAGIVDHLRTLLAWRDQFAPGRPLWDDEWGANVLPADSDYPRHADLTARQLLLDRALGIQHSDIYTWDGHEYRLWSGRRPTPAAIAFRTVAQRLTNVIPAAIISEGQDGIFAYLFRKGDGFVLAAWCVEDNHTRSLEDIPVSAKSAALYDLMGNPRPLRVERGKTRLILARGPVYMEGVDGSYLANHRRLKLSPNGSPPARHSSVWYSFHYPEGSEVFSLPRGVTRNLVLRVYNDGPKAVRTTLDVVSPEGTLKVTPARIEVTVGPRSVQTVRVQATPKGKLKDGIYCVTVRGIAEGQSCGNMKIRGYVAEGETTLFHMATWEMTRHLVAAEGFGQGVHIRWIQPKGFLKFKFDLAQARAARLASYIDSSSPAFFDGGNFRLSASADDQQWTVLLEGRGPFAWRDVDLTPYAGRKVFIRFDNPTDKGEARIRQMRLTVFEK